MAAGDFVWFHVAKLKLGQKKIHLGTDTFKFAFLSNSVTPTAATDDPCFGAGGTTNLATYEVSGGNVPAGGVTLTSVAFTEAAGAIKWTFAAPSVAQNASNPSAARWAVVYSSTAANLDCLGFLDLGGVTNLAAAGFSATPPAAGVLTY